MKALVAFLIFLTITASWAAPPHERDGRLVDEHNMTLYVFNGSGFPDSKSCEGDCARNFPPALAAPGDVPSGSLQLLNNGHGERQWAFEGKPLYRGLMDKKPGDHGGDGLNTVWHIVQPR
ncbi:transcriptional regulator [Caballeronia sp. J97]|uniref:COG4315 family predicted lipoprotein n=1 Tax=Caballeronia sp. J97 TaxID=2805429 RepID=UPI002AB2777C|nr:transcriptional regulator [Caballeronia sp. J97]